MKPYLIVNYVKYNICKPSVIESEEEGRFKQLIPILAMLYNKQQRTGKLLEECTKPNKDLHQLHCMIQDSIMQLVGMANKELDSVKYGCPIFNFELVSKRFNGERYITT